MNPTNMFNFKAKATKITQHKEILQQIQDVEASFDEQLPCKKQYNAALSEVNLAMQNHHCNCNPPSVNSLLQCQYGCSCHHFRKTCDIKCACKGFCIPNTFLHLPQLDVRLGIAGNELYTEEDIDIGCLAYVFTGKMTSLKHFLKKSKGKPPNLYALIAKWEGEATKGICKFGIPSFVVDTYKEVAGFVNHGCNPNTEVFEIWQNGKIYIVGRSKKICFKGDTLTYDYNWTYTDDAKYAELCLCGSSNCRTFIAKIPPTVMQRSILHYRSLLDEMESHNSTETHRLDSLQDALRHGAPLSAQQQHDVQHLRRCTEELRLTQRKAIYLKKGLLMAQAKLADIHHQERYLHLLEARLSSFQPLPDDTDGDDGCGVHSPHGASSPLSVASSDGGAGAPAAICFPGESSRSGDGDDDDDAGVVVSDVVVPSSLQKHAALCVCEGVGDGVGGGVGEKSILDSTTSCVQKFHDMEALDYTENFAIAIKEENILMEEKSDFSNSLRKDVHGIIKDWKEGLLTQDEIQRVYSWIDGTMHARGGGSQIQPWPNAKDWIFWLHTNFRQPSRMELDKHGKSWVGISTKTLRMANSKKVVTSHTLPLARDVKIILSDVLTFIPFRFKGFSLVESPKSGTIWRIVWNIPNEPLPGNPILQTTG